ncbi:MAG: SPOR domain-containing protein [Pseudomonadales bacterium]|nr:SPOR domain-containing protein [Pseudomonadales bacterium]
MIASELKSKLLAEGCSESNFAILSPGNDVFCLVKRGYDWVVYYTERGCDSEPIYKSKSEKEACQFFYNYILEMERWHLVGFFKEKSNVVELESKLDNAEIDFIRNDIPWKVIQDAQLNGIQ